MKKSLLFACAFASAFSAFATPPNPPVDAPEGTLYPTVYGCSDKTYLVSQGGLGAFTDNFGYATQLVVNDKDIYVYNIVREYGLNAWVKGTVGADGNAVFKFPQEVATDVNGKKLYVAMLTPVQGATSVDLKADTENPDLVMSWDGKTLKQLFKNDEEAALTNYQGTVGLVDEDGAFRSYGEKGLSYTIWDQAPLEAPENLVTSEYSASYTDQWNDPVKKMFRLGILEGEAWIQGLCTLLPEAWVKGTVAADGSITLTSDQYLGIINDYFFFFYGAEKKDYAANAPFVWAESVVLKPTETGYEASAPMMINLGHTKPWFGFGIKGLTLTARDAMDMTPKNPEFGDPEWDPNDEIGIADFFIPNEDVNGLALDTENLYYRMYFDGELSAVAWDETTGEPIYDLKYAQEYEPLVMYMYEWHFVIMMEKYSTVGVQSVYKVGDKEFTSDIVTSSITGGVRDLTATAKDVREVKYYNLSGAEIAAPSGLHIRRTTFTDGSVSTVKAVAK
ncbi:MAG: hypothetical protein K2M19_02630 [Muribaculaceae bacterium]|nr:hypothetical protein [Muribaculaceae bacterium]